MAYQLVAAMSGPPDPEWESPDELDRQAQAEADPPPGRPRLALVPDTKITLYNLDAERALLGAALISTRGADALATINAGDFGDPGHALIAETITTLHADNQPVDPVTVADHLRRHGQLDLACPDGTTTLLHLQADAPPSTSAPRYALILDELATLRAIGHYGHDIATAATNPGTNPGDLATRAQTLLDELHDRATARTSHLHRVDDLLDDYIAALEARDGHELTGITTGLRDLDEATGGLQNERLYTIAGRPGLGKSDIAVHLAQAAAAAGHQVLVLSIEMSDTEVMDRLLASHSGIPATRISTGRIHARDWDHLNPALVQLGGTPIWIDDNPTATIGTMRASARRANAELIIVDYLQIIDTPGAETRQVEVTALARALKRLARQLEVPVVALAQLNRGPEARFDKRPLLSDLRESGAIEQESDVVIGLYRDDYYHRDSKDRGVLELIPLKNRTGPQTTIRVGYRPDVKQILNLAKDA